MLNDLARSIYKANAAKGFWPEEPTTRNKPEALMLMVCELAEAMEAFRKNRFAVEVNSSLAHLNALSTNQGDLEIFKAHFQDNIKDTFEDELADTLIRILDYVGGFNIDIDAHIKTKLAYNATRPYKHGKTC